MDHKNAEAQQSAEKYMLGELSPQERSQFEEHLFDCPICADLVRQTFTVTENLKEVLREQKQARLEKVQFHKPGWRAWFQVSSLVPTCAALVLACFIGYQDFGSTDHELAQVVVSPAPLKPVSRSSSVQLIQIDRKEARTIVKFSADGLARGTFELVLDNASRPLAGGTKSTDDPVEVDFLTKALNTGRHTLVFHSIAKPQDAPITYTFEVRDAN